MTDIAIQSELKALSFEKGKVLSKSQWAIYDLIVKKATAGEVLRKDEIVELYLTVEPRIYYRYIGAEVKQYVYGHPLWPKSYRDEKYEKEPMTANHYGTKSKAHQWFRNNLATCIIKGKILAIPVIEDSE